MSPTGFEVDFHRDVTAIRRALERIALLAELHELREARRIYAIGPTSIEREVLDRQIAAIGAALWPDVEL